MPARATAVASSVVLIFGDDDHAVRTAGQARFESWRTESDGMDHEIIDAAASNSGEALTAVRKLREALNTLPFFGGGKAVWFKGCSFLGDDRTSTSAVVTEAVGELAAELKTFEFGDVRLLITTPKIDKRKVLYKTLQKLGETEEHGGWSINDRDWSARAAVLVRNALKARDKDVSEAALAEMVEMIGPNPQQLAAEAEKISLYVGDRPAITPEDVRRICARNKQARAFALSEAFGDRDLPAALRLLDEELWSMQFDKKKSSIGLLYGLVSKVRTLLMVQAMIKAGWLRPRSGYNEVKSRLESLPEHEMPRDRRYNPKSINPFVLTKALPQAGNFSPGELVHGMERLLEANRQIVSSSQEDGFILQQALVDILGARSGPRGSRQAI